MARKDFIELGGKKVEFQTHHRTDPLYFRRLYLIIGARFARLLLKTDITANQVSLVRLVLGLIGVVFFIHPLFIAGPVQYIYLVIGMVLFQVSMIFDCADGTIARTRNSVTNYGRFVDFTSDRILEVLVFFAIVFAAYMQTGNVLIWVIGALAIGAESLIVTHKMSMQFIYELPQNDLSKSVKKKRRLFGLITYTSFTSHFIMIIAVLLNQLFWFIVLMTIYFWVFYLGLVGLSHKKLRAKL